MSFPIRYAVTINNVAPDTIAMTIYGTNESLTGSMFKLMSVHNVCMYMWIVNKEAIIANNHKIKWGICLALSGLWWPSFKEILYVIFDNRLRLKGHKMIF